MKRMSAVMMVAALIMRCAPAAADTFEVAKASVTLPVLFETTDTHGVQVIATKTLKSADLVNLTLGRALGTKLDKTTEVLAFAANATTPGAGSKLIVFNPTAQTITATVWIFGNDFQLLSNETFTKNVAIGSLEIQATVVGDPAHHGFKASSVFAGGTGKQGSATSTAVIGPVSFTFTDDSNVTKQINGLVIKGKVKSGGSLAVLP